MSLITYHQPTTDLDQQENFTHENYMNFDEH